MYACNVCDAAMQSVKSYVCHMRLHRNVGNVRFKCCVRKCPNTFATFAAFSTHLTRYHSSSKVESRFDGCRDFNVSLRCALTFCDQRFAGTKNLINHLKMHLAESVDILCPYVNCMKKFSKKSSFTSHMSRLHPKLTFALLDSRHKVNVSLETAADVSESNADLTSDVSGFMDSSLGDDECDIGDSSLDMTENFKRSLALFYLKLQTKLLIPASTVQLIVNEFNTVNAMNLEFLTTKTRLHLSTTGIEPEVINKMLREVMGSDLLSHCNSGDLRNDYMRKKFYKQHFNYVEPKPYFLGLDSTRKERFGQYVPIKSTILSLFKHSTVRNQFLNPLDKKPNVLSDIVDGSVLSTNKWFNSSPSTLQIILYQDAFELVNPLGSARKKHKLLAVYMTLANIYPYHRSTVDQMQLVLLCKESDLKLFGWKKILCPLIDDLKDIETTGINLFNDMVSKGSVVCMLGDNLGSHGVGGFIESFSANYFCRFCLITRDEFVECTHAVGEMRTVDSYQEDVKLASNGSHSRGVKADSVMNNLSYFHVCAPGLPPCIGHDLFEGVVDFDLFLYINHMVNQLKWFSYEYLNRRVLQFKYTGDDAAAKPVPINPQGRRLGGQAAQNWCMLRLLPLLIGEKLSDADQEVWQLYLLLKKIVELVCCKFITHAQIAYMQVLVEDYLDRRTAAFPEENLRPKHHYMLHYGSLTLKLGPLQHLWTMRFESKHSYFKRCIRYSQNFKNVCATLAERHQLLQSYFSGGELFPPEVETACGLPFHSNLFNADVMKCVEGLGFNDENTVVCASAIVRGSKFDIGYYVAFSEVAGVSFGKILSIFLVNNHDAHFLLECVTSKYLPDRHVYYLTRSKCMSFQCISESELSHIGALHGYEYANGILITMKSALPV